MWFSLLGVCIYVLLCWALWVTRPSSHIHAVLVEDNSKIIKSIICLLTILACTLPMNLSPVWNGEEPDHRDQYEKIATSFLHGHLYFEEEVDSRLQAMDNPYDFDARVEEDVHELYWDHAYYKGHLYMYFGVVPAITLFVPYQYLTGNSLTTYHATQLYVAFFILGYFLLFHLLARLFFQSISLIIYLALSVALSIISVVYIVATPAMYCTAQSAALCFIVWSFLFYFKAVFNSNSEKKTILFSTIAATLGALSFGCRPTIALANIIAIPLSIVYFKRNSFSIRKIAKFGVVLIPYCLIGVGLMWYNYARFDNPFEFGQSYQLTVDDQSTYTEWTSRFSLSTIWSNIVFCLFSIPSDFNPVLLGGIVAYPIIWLSIFAFGKICMCYNSWKQSLISFLLLIITIVGIIILSISLFSPFPLPRYRLDFMWLLAITVFVVLGFTTAYSRRRNYWNFFIFFTSLLSVLVCVRQFFYPYDMNYAEYFEDTVPQTVHQVFLPFF